MHLFFPHPTSPVAKGHVSARWYPGGPYWSPQATIFAPKTSLLSLAAFQEGKDQEYSLETAKCTFSSLTPPHPWQGAMHLPSGTLGTPIGAPKQQYSPSKTSPLSLDAFQKGKDQLYSLETAKYTFSSLTGEVGFFGGSDGGPQGPRWPMHRPLPWEVG